MSMHPLGFAHQQYGNPDLAIQQMRNQNQLVNDQINNFKVSMDAMKKENDKQDAELKDYKKKKIKDLKHKKDESSIDLEFAKDKYNGMESKRMQIEYYADKAQQLEKEMIEKEGENNKFGMENELQEKKTSQT